LIVYPLLGESWDEEQFSHILGRSTAVIIGPGLGRHPLAIQTAKRIFHLAHRRKLPLVIDGVQKDLVFLDHLKLVGWNFHDLLHL
jgi:NAD(P)H-hydrate repair Nnr-like enzyme with NAD(P)H-hydrate dehydratase domain